MILLMNLKDLIKNLRKHHYENFRKFLELSPNYEVIYHKLKESYERLISILVLMIYFLIYFFANT